MNNLLTLSACNFLIPEISQVIKDAKYPDVELISYPLNCALGALSDSVISDVYSKASSDSDIVFFGSFCYAPVKLELPRAKNIHVIELQQCFELILNPETIYHYIKQGYYLVTSGWLRTVEKNIKEWGFDKISASQEFFRESMKSILLLDTGIPGDYKSNLELLSEYMGLPYEILPVGLSHCRKYIETVVLDWRSKKQQQRLEERLSDLNKQSADQELILNQLAILVRQSDEESIVKIGFELINVLFAPSKIVYNAFSLENMSFRFKGLFNADQFSDDNTFNIEIRYTDDLLGVFEVKGVQFPQFLDKYKDMGNLISQIFGMAIANARKYSELEKANQALKNSEAELSESNATKDKFFSIIAHDLKAPFNSLVGFSDLLIKQIGLKNYDRAEDFSVIIRDSSRRALSLLMNLMEWAQAQTGKMAFNPEQFDLTSFITELQLFYKNMASQKGVSIKTVLLSESFVNADQAMINTVLRNLISNAIKFTSQGEEVTISVRLQNSDYVVAVTDNGIGIPKEHIGKLFRIDETYSTRGTAEETGTGLGLILCRELIEMHGKEIWVESEEGIGATFYFSLAKANHTI